MGPAQEQEVVNAVNKKLNDLQALQCTIEEYIVKLRQYLPNLEDALKEVNGLEHLHSPDWVNLMVMGILPQLTPWNNI